ncbi:MAG: DsbA family protein [Salinivirgaceae bacterium]|nr:DsbA family protein [Salinivirgaceae bacterium]
MNKRKAFIILALAAIVAIVAIAALRHYKRTNFELRYVKTKVDITQNDWDIVLGNDSAQLTIIMYVNYNCTYCHRFLNIDYKYLKEKYVDNGLVKFVLKPIDLTGNKQSIMALQMAICLNQIGELTDYHDILLLEPHSIYTNEFADFLTDLAENNQIVGECVNNNCNYVELNNKEFNTLGLKGTPAFVIGNKVYKGYRKLKYFEQIINTNL